MHWEASVTTRKKMEKNNIKLPNRIPFSHRLLKYKGLVAKYYDPFTNITSGSHPIAHPFGADFLWSDRSLCWIWLAKQGFQTRAANVSWRLDANGKFRRTSTIQCPVHTTSTTNACVTLPNTNPQICIPYASALSATNHHYEPSFWTSNSTKNPWSWRLQHAVPWWKILPATKKQGMTTQCLWQENYDEWNDDSLWNMFHGNRLWGLWTLWRRTSTVTVSERKRSWEDEPLYELTKVTPRGQVDDQKEESRNFRSSKSWFRDASVAAVCWESLNHRQVYDFESSHDHQSIQDSDPRTKQYGMHFQELNWIVLFLNRVCFRIVKTPTSSSAL
jgi:hypothetical protein